MDESCCAPLDDPMSGDDAIELASAFAALGDPVRLRLLSLIAAAGESCSCEMEGLVDRSQATVSHHLKVLAEAGLIEGEKRGRWRWYRIVPDRLDALAGVLRVAAPA